MCHLGPMASLFDILLGLFTQQKVLCKTSLVSRGCEGFIGTCTLASCIGRNSELFWDNFSVGNTIIFSHCNVWKFTSPRSENWESFVSLGRRLFLPPGCPLLRSITVTHISRLTWISKGALNLQFFKMICFTGQNYKHGQLHSSGPLWFKYVL